MWIKYAILGKDVVFSQVPVTQDDHGMLWLDDAMYDYVETPLYPEAIYIGLPVVASCGEYWNPITRLYMIIAEEGE